MMGPITLSGDPGTIHGSMVEALRYEYRQDLGTIGEQMADLYEQLWAKRHTALIPQTMKT